MCWKHDRGQLVMHGPDLWSWIPEITAYADFNHFMPWWNIGIGRGTGRAQQGSRVYVRWGVVDQAQTPRWEDWVHVRGGAELQLVCCARGDTW